ncbi:MAG: hypothetical protein R6W76_11780, partial [Caldilinea sp.]
PTQYYTSETGVYASHTTMRRKFDTFTSDEGLVQLGGARHVPGTVHQISGHAVICCTVPGTFPAPTVK